MSVGQHAGDPVGHPRRAVGGLRERRRDELVGQVVATARRHLAAEGLAAMSLRAVAREIGIAPSALYRYFPSRDDLLTELIVRTFVEVDAVLDAAVTRALADHPGDPVSAWADATVGYRRWALAHPADFALVYGTPLPGYVAPEGSTREVGRRSGEALGRILTTALQHGLVDVDAVADAGASMSEPMREGLAHDAGRRGVDLPEPLAAGLMELALGAWSQLQGLVAMEVFGHLPPVAPFAEEFFRRRSRAVVAGRLLGSGAALRT